MYTNGLEEVHITRQGQSVTISRGRKVQYATLPQAAKFKAVLSRMGYTCVKKGDK